MIASDPDTGVAPECAASAAVATAVLLAWQAFIVFFGYGGAWTALFMTGDSGPAAPPALISTGYVFKNNKGFDGQYYRYVAHDPLFRHGLDAYMDLAPLRYQRILVPGLAWILAGFREEFRRAGRMVPGGRELCAKTPFAKSRKGARNIHLIFIGSPPGRVPIHDSSWFTRSPTANLDDCDLPTQL